MSEEAARALAYAVRRVVVNRVTRAGDRWRKHRAAGTAMVIAAGNLYLRRAGGFSMLVARTAWGRHEVEVHRALYGEDAAGFVDAETVWMMHTPGVTLSKLVQGADPSCALRAAGRELRRVHATAIEGCLFSHGDLHLSNVLYCAAERRARLIDFETVHDAQDAATRHADDRPAWLWISLRPRCSR